MTIFTAKLKRFLENHPNVDGFAISAPTEENAQTLIQAFFELGFFWDNENPENSKHTVEGKLNTKWEKNNAKTCYTVSLIPNKQIFFCNTKFYEKRGREIYSLEDINDIELPDYELRFLEDKTESDNANEDTTECKKTNVETAGSNQGGQEPKYLCPYCGYEIKKGIKFCPDCGQRINEPVLADELDKTNEDLTDRTYTPEDNNDNEIKSENVSISESEIGEPALSENEKTTENEYISETSANKSGSNVVSFADNDNSSIEVATIEEVDIKQNSQNITDNNASETSTDNNKPLILKMLGLEVNEEFHIIPDNYFNTKNIYRFNKNGYREIKTGDNIWFTANDEQDLTYIINHPDEIQIITKK